MFAWALGTQEILVLLVLGVLLFGRKLPEVGRSLGKSIVEFKKGLGGLEEDDGFGVPRGPSPPPRITNASANPGEKNTASEDPAAA
jgi:sec-independent protein translocase protein TatA